MAPLCLFSLWAWFIPQWPSQSQNSLAYCSSNQYCFKCECLVKEICLKSCLDGSKSCFRRTDNAVLFHASPQKMACGKKISFSLQGVSKGGHAQTSLSFLGRALLQKSVSFFQPSLFWFFFQESGFNCWKFLKFWTSWQSLGLSSVVSCDLASSARPEYGSWVWTEFSCINLLSANLQWWWNCTATQYVLNGLIGYMSAQQKEVPSVSSVVPFARVRENNSFRWDAASAGGFDNISALG